MINLEKRWYQKPSNWLTILICIILIPVLFMNCFILFQANSNKDEVPSVFGYKPFIVLSGSMENEIRIGDLIVVKNINPQKLVKGDVIAFRDAEDTVTTHRIIDIVESDGVTYFVTKGDNNSSQDQNLVEYQDVEGIYRFRVPAVGTILNSLASPMIIVIMILSITIIFILAFYASTKRQRDKEHQEFLEYKRQKEIEEKIKSSHQDESI